MVLVSEWYSELRVTVPVALIVSGEFDLGYGSGNKRWRTRGLIPAGLIPPKTPKFGSMSFK